MKKFKKLIKNHLGLALLALAVLLIGTGVVAQGNSGVIIQNVENFVFGGQDGTLGSGIATLTGDTNFTTNVVAERNVDLQATTTIQELSLGSRYAEALTFTAGSTTTPGSLTSMQNTGAPKLCTTIELDLTTADTTNGRLGTGHPMNFSIGTSTAASTWSTSAGGLVGTTTVATGTTMLITNTSFPGSATSTPGASWIWGAGVYLLGAFDSVAGDAATSSDAYTGMAGRIYVTCHTR